MRIIFSSRGNAMFLILIAVALFAALSYAITSSSRNSGDASKEKTMIGAADIVGFLGLAEQTASRMILTAGVRHNQLGLRGGYWQLWDGTPAYACESGFDSGAAYNIYDSAGGGVPPRAFEEYGITNPACCGALKPGHVRLMYSNINGMGGALQDVVMQIVFVKPGICNEINRQEGIITAYTGSDTNVANASTDFRCSTSDIDTLTGSFGYNADETIFSGHSLFCAPLLWNGIESLTVVKVLVAR